jgi:hypothetical protein
LWLLLLNYRFFCIVILTTYSPFLFSPSLHAVRCRHHNNSAFSTSTEKHPTKKMYKIYSHPSGHGNPRRSKKQRQSSINRIKIPTADKKLEVAVDHVLLEHHQGKLPKKKQRSPLTVTHRDSYSTISTDPNLPDTNMCHVVLDERRGGFIPLEISFPAVDADYKSFPSMPLLQKSKAQRLPDSRNVFDFYGDDDDNNWDQDIVFVPVDAEAASVSSSLEVVRNISSRYIISDDMDEILSKAAARVSSFDVPATRRHQTVPTVSSTDSNGNDSSSGITTVRRARPGLPHRIPSKGPDLAGPTPPLRQGMHELSFFVRRVEI